MILSDIARSVVEGQADSIQQLTEKALKESISAETILNEGFLAAMETVGKGFKEGEFFVPEVLAAAQVMKKGMEVLRPSLIATNVRSRGLVAIGTVAGDLHDIGKNIVAMMLEGAGFSVLDLGIDVPVERFVSVTREERPLALGMSSLLTTTMPEMKKVIDALRDANLRDSVTVMVGGAPVSAEFAASIGADVYARDAGEAAEKMKALVA